MRRFLVFLLIAVHVPVPVAGHGEETRIEVLPSSISYERGEEVTVTVLLHTKEPVTSLELHLNYEAETLAPRGITRHEENFPFWWSSEARKGVVVLQASKQAPGFQGDGQVATIVFEAVATGASEVVLGESSLVLNEESENLLGKETPQVGSSEDLSSEGFMVSGAIRPGIILGVGIAIGIGGGMIYVLRRKK